MGKLLCGFYLFVGLFTFFGIFITFEAKEFVLSQWLFLATIINFSFFSFFWKHERNKVNGNEKVTV